MKTPGARSRDKSVPLTDQLYWIWTGDNTGGFKQAERIAWKIEQTIAAERIALGERIGSERDLSKRFSTGLGVAREALEILDLRGVCSVRRGPGGGVFIARPSEKVTAQRIVHYLISAGTTVQHLHQAEGLMSAKAALRALDENPAIRLFREVLTQIHQCADKAFCRHQLLSDTVPNNTPISEITQFRWMYAAHFRASAGKLVAWKIAQSILDDKNTGRNRLGSEWDLQHRYCVSHASMRNATRLLEAFGIAESLPGRGKGLYSLAPGSGPAIRGMNSYFQQSQMSAESWSAALQVFGTFALKDVLKSSDRRLMSILLAARTELNDVTRRAGLTPSRNLLRSLLEFSGNPLVILFHRALAGYAFRSFDAGNLERLTARHLFWRRVSCLIDAGLGGDHDLAVHAYLQLFPNDLKSLD